MIRYHRTYRLSDDMSLVEEAPASTPQAGAIAAEVAELQHRQADLNRRLQALDVARDYRDQAPSIAGIFPLSVVNFTCSCECEDDDGMCEQLTERLGNLKVITEVPFMRKGNLIFAIRSQGLVDSATGAAESVDSLFNGGIYWRGDVNEQRYDYELLMFRIGKDKCVGRMTESIDLTRKLGDIDPGMYQSEVAYHLEKESADASGQPTLGRQLDAYGSAREIEQVAQCYLNSLAFSNAVKNGSGDLPALAEAARLACIPVPGKRYYQAYEAFLQGIRYPLR